MLLNTIFRLWGYSTMNKKDKIADFLNTYIFRVGGGGGKADKKIYPSNKNVGNISRNKSIELSSINSPNNHTDISKDYFLAD